MLKYKKPELTCYGSVAVGYFSPSNTIADCLCDCTTLAHCSQIATAGISSCDVDVASCCSVDQGCTCVDGGGCF